MKTFNKAFVDKQMMFYNEVASMFACRKHPNVIKLFQVFDEEKRYLLVQELCPYGDLSSLSSDDVDTDDDFQIAYILR